MQIIPVIDLAGGVVVRAVRGERSRYRPIESALCRSHAAEVVAPILLDYCASRILYVADLDALCGGPIQQALLMRLLGRLPAIDVWLDAGFRDATAAQSLVESLGEHGPRLRPVFASEALPDAAVARACLQDSGRAILSLDRRGDALLDPADCWATPGIWPQQIIVMTLERVGSGEGPDLGTLGAIRRQKPAASVIGAGGVRSDADIVAAADAGAAGWLVASAVHDMTISAR